MNDGYPIMLTVIVNDKGLDKATASFKGELLKAPGPDGHTDGHVVVTTDYVVDGVPGHGTIGEGNVSAELKAAALAGTLRYIKVKNSWGLENGSAQSDGYFKFYKDYLVDSYEFRNPLRNRANLRSGLQSVVLPPGY